MFDGDTDGFEELNRVLDPIVFSVKYFFYISEIDESFGAGHAREMSDENKLLYEPGRIAVDHRIFFGVQAPAIAGLVAIASVVQPGRVAIVADGENFSEVSRGDDGPDLETMASGAGG